MKKIFNTLLAMLIICSFTITINAAETTKVDDYIAHEELVSFFEPYVGKDGTTWISSDDAYRIISLGYSISKNEIFIPEQPVFTLNEGIWFSPYFSKGDIKAIGIWGYCPNELPDEQGYPCFCHMFWVKDI